MTKNKIQFICTQCGASHLQWQGQCSKCNSWNSLEEAIVDNISDSLKDLPESKVQKLTSTNLEGSSRITTGFSELNKTLGGGLISGSVVLIGGSPGIGKSTLILQCLANINKKYSTFYISGEESSEQISSRAKRLNINEDILLISETKIDKIISLAKKIKPKVMVIDSIQTMESLTSQSVPGSVSQVRNCSLELSKYCKITNTTLLLIGHMTKDGTIAGPRILEHMVDVVLYFEGDSSDRYRVIRAVKNRFGTVNELSIFAMSDTGLKQVKNPSAIFLNRSAKKTPGSIVTVIKQGSKSLLVEIQALVDKTNIQTRRVCVGIEQNRLILQLAILHKHGGIVTMDQDVFINVVGGIKINETAIDLAVILAVISSIRNQTIAKNLVAFGEIGLTGEIRPVYNGQERLKEAQKHGFSKAIIPKDNCPKENIKGLEIAPVSYLHEALSYIF